MRVAVALAVKGAAARTNERSFPLPFELGYERPLARGEMSASASSVGEQKGRERSRYKVERMAGHDSI